MIEKLLEIDSNERLFNWFIKFAKEFEIFQRPLRDICVYYLGFKYLGYKAMRDLAIKKADPFEILKEIFLFIKPSDFEQFKKELKKIK